MLFQFSISGKISEKLLNLLNIFLTFILETFQNIGTFSYNFFNFEQGKYNIGTIHNINHELDLGGIYKKYI